MSESLEGTRAEQALQILKQDPQMKENLKGVPTGTGGPETVVFRKGALEGRADLVRQKALSLLQERGYDDVKVSLD